MNIVSRSSSDALYMRIYFFFYQDLAFEIYSQSKSVLEIDRNPIKVRRGQDDEPGKG